MASVLPSGAVQLRLVRVLTPGGTTAIGNTVTIPGLTYAAGETLALRAEAVGAAPTTLRARVWREGTAEPAAWQVTGQDSSSALQGPGSPGLLAYLAGGATNAPVRASHAELRVTAP